MDFAMIHNIGAFIQNTRAADNSTLTAGSTGDNTLVTGVIVDRSLFGLALSVALGISFKAVLAAGKSLSFTVLLETGEDSGLSDASTFYNGTATVAASSVGGGTVRGSFDTDIDLAGAGRYIRAKYTPDLSNTTSDTAECAAVFVFGGTESIPV